MNHAKDDFFKKYTTLNQDTSFLMYNMHLKLFAALFHEMNHKQVSFETDHAKSIALEIYFNQNKEHQETCFFGAIRRQFNKENSLEKINIIKKFYIFLAGYVGEKILYTSIYPIKKQNDNEILVKARGDLKLISDCFDIIKTQYIKTIESTDALISALIKEKINELDIVKTEALSYINQIVNKLMSINRENNKNKKKENKRVIPEDYFRKYIKDFEERFEDFIKKFDNENYGKIPEKDFNTIVNSIESNSNEEFEKFRNDFLLNKKNNAILNKSMLNKIILEEVILQKGFIETYNICKQYTHKNIILSTILMRLIYEFHVCKENEDCCDHKKNNQLFGNDAKSANKFKNFLLDPENNSLNNDSYKNDIIYNVIPMFDNYLQMGQSKKSFGGQKSNAKDFVDYYNDPFNDYALLYEAALCFIIKKSEKNDFYEDEIMSKISAKCWCGKVELKTNLDYLHYYFQSLWQNRFKSKEELEKEFPMHNFLLKAVASEIENNQLPPYSIFHKLLMHFNTNTYEKNKFFLNNNFFKGSMPVISKMQY